MQRVILFLFISLSFLRLNAQEGTLNPGTAKKTAPGIMIVPFEPKLYMSDMDQKINQQTKWKFDQIREYFRHQLDNQLKQKLQSSKPVISFYNDSAKMSKDLHYVYKSTSITFEKVNKTPGTPAEKVENIKDGQLTVAISSDAKYTNTAITDAELLGYLSKKYNAEHFLFVNELDLVMIPDSYDLASDSFKREAVVHYTILDKAGKTITAGVTRSSFSSKENNPKKIVSGALATVAASIANRYNTTIHPPAPKK